MWQLRERLDRAAISCSICLDLLKDPVTVPCGHSYCSNCINGFWDGEDQTIYSCPQCRQAFTPRPRLVKTTMLADLVEQLKKTGLQAAAADHCYARAGDVSCDVCPGRKLKAVKSCLVCLASYCNNHLQPHYQSAAFEKHKLVDPSEKLQENVCSHHHEVMKMFCRTDQQIICYLCSVEEHRGRDTVSVAAERFEKQKELEVSRQKIQQRIQDREEDVKLLQQQLEDISRSGNKAVEDNEEIFTQLIRLLQKRSSEMEQQIRYQQKIEMIGVIDVQEKLQQEIRELRWEDAELELLSHTEDHNQFLHSYPSLSQLSEDTSRIKIRPLRGFEDVTAAVSELRDQLQDVLKDKWTNISLIFTEEPEEPEEPGEPGEPEEPGEPGEPEEPGEPGEPEEPEEPLFVEPETRAEFLEYSCEITLDPNTANTKLLLSDGNRKVERTSQQPYSSHPDRFSDYYIQVLSRQSLTGRCYWEVEMRRRGVGVAVSDKNISRSGDESLFGYNDKSWCLECYTSSYKFSFNNISTPVSGPVSSRLGVFLDHTEGLLSFYSVSETMTLLHRVQTTFTQPLYAGLRLYHFGSTAELCNLR